jgi:hypothetical protein
MASVVPTHHRITLLDLVVRLEDRGLRHREILRLVPQLVNEGRVRLTGCCCDGRFRRRG